MHLPVRLPRAQAVLCRVPRRRLSVREAAAGAGPLGITTCGICLGEGRADVQPHCLGRALLRERRHLPCQSRMPGIALRARQFAPRLPAAYCRPGLTRGLRPTLTRLAQRSGGRGTMCGSCAAVDTCSTRTAATPGCGDTRSAPPAAPRFRQPEGPPVPCPGHLLGSVLALCLLLLFVLSINLPLGGNR